ncbi:MarR family transcriptional regulator [Afipia sp. P52-10]|jgi:DNA-binding MarR family transcriptional regulator/GNAT superfamily N-acetyltransferase|uniref:bifunctional helix-turn-helix transcriptional regulator/GNAT family N-acetyltransferase n=1 Tax=Afipia sp. P52-10 TaxID=1429916 RepID=UPI0003DEF8CC|nr:helix-turn-helix domain-containing GNAT family N-acetyltransferase [Afipia sp. P52-10]ETR76820.1 MarR family transcriptional regulator [Afipia sp. P52-10]
MAKQQATRTRGEQDLDGLQADVAAVRRFNRFYTRQIGLIEPKHLHTSVSLPEARILYELAHRQPLSPKTLADDLGIDPGQLSRMLQSLQQRQLLSRKPSTFDRRQVEIALSAKGRATFADLDKRTQEFVTTFLQGLAPERRGRVVRAMDNIERALKTNEALKSPIVLRTHRAGDVGWIISRHGALYAEEFGWSIDFEALVAEIAAQFVKTYDPERERCWIAEIDGERAGTVTLVKGTKTTAKLRLLLVEPSARGTGVGKALVGECLRFARQAGYKSVTLWTQSILIPARRIYQDAGFRLVETKPHHSFGADLVGETWTLAL